MPYTCVLVDLDGTIVDSAPGITEDLAAALVEAGLPVPPPARLLEFVGPPILDGLRQVCGLTGDAAQDVLDRYRRRYRVGGAFRATPFDGVPDALHTLGAHLPLAVATSKPESIASQILHHLGLTDRFVVIAGAADDESRSDKAEVIARAIALLAAAGVDTAAPVMIGDRIHDIAGAAAHGIPAIWARWGYGSPAEAAGAIAIADSPADLPGLVSSQRPAATESEA